MHDPFEFVFQDLGIRNYGPCLLLGIFSVLLTAEDDQTCALTNILIEPTTLCLCIPTAEE